MTTDFHLVELAHTARQSDGDAFRRLVGTIVELHRATAIARYGNDDIVSSPDTILTTLEATAHQRAHYLLALPGPAPAGDGAASGRPIAWQVPAEFRSEELWGAAFLRIPLLENTNQVHDIDIVVHPGRRRRGVGRALARAVARLAAGLGRDTLMGWCDSTASNAPDALRSNASEVSIARDGNVQFLLAMGYRLVQTERHSVQQLASRRFTAPRLAGGYRIETWHGDPPTDFQPLCARLQTAMTTDAPNGDFEPLTEQWDAERYLEWAQRIGRNHDMLTSLAIHDATGEPAGFSQLIRDRTRPAAVEQRNTLVARAHRGHGLGLAIKQANLVALARYWPDAERIHTWNATENDRMWAINKLLGYRVVSIDSGWQQRL